MNHITETHIAEFLLQIYDTLGKSPEALKELYPGLLPNFSERQKNRDKLFRISSELFPLSCFVNKEDKCDAAYFSLDLHYNRGLIRQIINYLNRTFQYSYLVNMWTMKEGTIQLKADRQTVMIIVTKRYPLPENIRDL